MVKCAGLFTKDSWGVFPWRIRTLKLHVENAESRGSHCLWGCTDWWLSAILYVTSISCSPIVQFCVREHTSVMCFAQWTAVSWSLVWLAAKSSLRGAVKEKPPDIQLAAWESSKPSPSCRNDSHLCISGALRRKGGQLFPHQLFLVLPVIIDRYGNPSFGVKSHQKYYAFHGSPQDNLFLTLKLSATFPSCGSFPPWRQVGILFFCYHGAIINLCATQGAILTGC